MEQRIVALQIANEFIVGSGVSIGAAGSHDDVLLEMDFRNSAPWAGTTRRAIFSNALGENRTPIVLTTNLLAEGHTDVYLVPVPAEAKDVAGECFLTVEGYIGEGNSEILRIVTQEATFRVLPSKLYHNDNPSLAPTEAEQLQTEIEKIKEDIVKAAKAADAAERAERAVGKTSYIGANGNWYEWDAEKDDFVDTGVKAQGDITVDSRLSETSENPVQNRVITQLLSSFGKSVLPYVTEDDNGKMLRVVNGAWVKNAVASVDLSNFESAGVIRETYSDDSVVTHTFEYDSDGNPVKITDSNGNVTTLLW